MKVKRYWSIALTILILSMMACRFIVSTGANITWVLSKNNKKLLMRYYSPSPVTLRVPTSPARGEVRDYPLTLRVPTSPARGEVRDYPVTLRVPTSPVRGEVRDYPLSLCGRGILKLNYKSPK
jgi:hypothetical protein